MMYVCSKAIIALASALCGNGDDIAQPPVLPPSITFPLLPVSRGFVLSLQKRIARLAVVLRQVGAQLD